MKILGALLLVVALLTAAAGWEKTSERSYLGIEEDIATNNVARARDQVHFVQALQTADPSDLVQIQDRKLLESCKTFLIEHGRLSGTDAQSLELKAALALAEAEAKLKDAHNSRVDTMRWYWAPAGVLALVGLILLVVPDGRRLPRVNEPVLAQKQ